MISIDFFLDSQEKNPKWINLLIENILASSNEIGMGGLILTITRCFVSDNDILNFHAGKSVDISINDTYSWFILDGSTSNLNKHRNIQNLSANILNKKNKI